jgi:hypothetical protein
LAALKSRAPAGSVEANREAAAPAAGGGGSSGGSSGAGSSSGGGAPTLAPHAPVRTRDKAPWWHSVLLFAVAAAALYAVLHVPLAQEAFPHIVRALREKWEAPFALGVPALLQLLHRLWGLGDKLDEMQTDAEQRELRAKAEAEEREQRFMDAMQGIAGAVSSSEKRVEARVAAMEERTEQRVVDAEARTSALVQSAQVAAAAHGTQAARRPP